MALNNGATLIPGRGTVFVGNVDAVPVTSSGINSLAPATPGTGWECIGHTSRDNTVSLGKDGGDVTQLGSWWDDAIVSTTDPTTWSVTINSLQLDALTLGLAFGGGASDTTLGTYKVGNISAVPKALMILMIGATSRFVIYCPNTSVTLGDAPEIDVANFFEVQLSASLLTSNTRSTRFEFISPILISA